jgi:hypothetical protein
MVRVAAQALDTAALEELPGIYLSALTEVKRSLLREDPLDYALAWRLKDAMNAALNAPAAERGEGWARIKGKGGGAHAGAAKVNQKHKERIFKEAVSKVFGVTMLERPVVESA